MFLTISCNIRDDVCVDSAASDERLPNSIGRSIPEGRRERCGYPPDAIKDEGSKEGAGGLETQKVQGAGKKGNKVTFVFPLRAFGA